MTPWTAHYLDGKRAARRRAAVEITPHELLIRVDGGDALRWRWTDVRQTQGFYAGEQVRLERGGDTPEVVLVDDQAFVTAVRRAVPAFGRAIHDPTRRRRRLLVAGVAGLAAFVAAGALYFWGIPAAAGVAAMWVPVAWEDRLGSAVITHLAPPEKQCRSPRGQVALQTIVTRLLAPVSPQPYTFRVVVVDHPMVNAMAAPGGHVVIMRGLIDRAPSPEALAGVVAHELQHVLHRHATQALLREVSSGLLVTAVSGDVSGAMVYGLESARVLSRLSYSRHAESEADASALRMLTAAQVDPHGMIAMFELMQAEDLKLPEVARYARTHPESRERAATLRALVGGGATGRPLLTDEQWQALRGICG